MKSHKTFIIAEAGSNHNRDFDTALRLIDAANLARCDAVKFQTYSSETLYVPGCPDYAKYKNINQLIKDIEIPREWQKDLKQYCDEVGIEFMSTPFDEKAVEELVELGVKRLKIAGFECTDPRFVKMVASTGLPIIMSLGIGSDISTGETLVHSLFRNLDLTMLHCNNAYPTPVADINLGQIQRIRQHYPPFCKVGLSDHTEGILIPPVAVAMGAEVIEKHFTLDRNMNGPDHPFAIEPDELFNMVRNIRAVETAMEERQEKYTKSEKDYTCSMRSVVSKTDIKQGDILTEDNISTMRPYTGGIPASQFYDVLGKVASWNIPENTCLRESWIYR